MDSCSVSSKKSGGSDRPKASQPDGGNSSEEDAISGASLTSGHISEAEVPAPVRVRDMIKKYNGQALATTMPNNNNNGNSNSNSPSNCLSPRSNGPPGSVDSPPAARSTPSSHSHSQSQSQHTLASVKSSFGGLNRFCSQSNVRQYVSQLEDAARADAGSSHNSNSSSNNNNQGARAARIIDDANWIREQRAPDINLDQGTKAHHQGGVLQAKPLAYPYSKEKEMKSVLGNTGNNFNQNLCLSTSGSASGHMMSGNESGMGVQQPQGDGSAACTSSMCQTYESKTTITKTATDDDVDESNVIGSRIETSIPSSTILSEFQEKAIQLS